MTDRRKMLWYDKIIINLYIAKYIWGGDGNMKKKRIEQNEIKRYFLIIAAFLSFMILSLLFFLSWLQQDVEVSSRKTVATNVERQSYHLKSVLDIQFNYLTGMASYMGEREDLFCNLFERCFPCMTLQISIHQQIWQNTSKQ